MAIHLDPEQHETAVLARFIPDDASLSVLEVGCGDGRLTRQYAERVGLVLAIDSDPAALAMLRATMPATLWPRVELRASRVDTLDVPEHAFGLVLLSWSL